MKSELSDLEIAFQQEVQDFLEASLPGSISEKVRLGKGIDQIFSLLRQQSARDNVLDLEGTVPSGTVPRETTIQRKGKKKGLSLKGQSPENSDPKLQPE